MLKINALDDFFRSILGFQFVFLGVFTFIFFACSSDENSSKLENACPPFSVLDSFETNNLKVGLWCGDSTIQIKSIIGMDTLVKNFILKKNENFRDKKNAGQYLKVPLTKVVTLSSAQIGYITRLAENHKIIAVGEKKYIADSNLYVMIEQGNVKEIGSGENLLMENLLALEPDLVMSFATGGGQDDYERINALKISLMLTSEWQEETPLAKAEWIKLYGILFNKKKQADSIFNIEKENYLAIQNQVNKDSACKGPKVLAGMSYGGVWYAPGGNSYTAKLIKDGGGCYQWYNDSSRELKLSLEEVLNQGNTFDVWINPGMFSTPEEILAMDPRVRDIKAFREKRVYQNDNRKGYEGGNDFFEGAVTYPSGVLHDLHCIFYNFTGEVCLNDTYFRNTKTHWYRNIFTF